MGKEHINEVAKNEKLIEILAEAKFACLITESEGMELHRENYSVYYGLRKAANIYLTNDEIYKAGKEAERMFNEYMNRKEGNRNE